MTTEKFNDPHGHEIEIDNAAREVRDNGVAQKGNFEEIRELIYDMAEGNDQWDWLGIDNDGLEVVCDGGQALPREPETVEQYVELLHEIEPSVMDARLVSNGSIHVEFNAGEFDISRSMAERMLSFGYITHGTTRSSGRAAFVPVGLENGQLTLR